MQVIRLFTIALIASVFAGCASYGPRAQPFNSEGKSVAYWVDLSDQLQLQWVGTTIFNNALFKRLLSGKNEENTRFS